MARITYTILKA